ncbi:Mu transposase C-terminal domain-containing protein [Marinomonas sp. S3726]|uniref:Mu transposase C-terminal domain-containing protein n=1 Tax=Marinomonas sp. S3726 TaxID=579484 RepID=UPI000AD157A9|nr:Mu transposase C-terminal domain-containing protein [Marinomonas sp. S3726]
MNNFESFFEGKLNEIESNQNKIAQTYNNDEELKDISAFSETLRNEAIHRYNIINYLIKNDVQIFTERHIIPHEPLLKEKFGDDIPNWRTISRWWKSFKESNFQIVSLVTTAKNKGNRVKRLEPEVDRLLNEYILRTLTAERPCLAEGMRCLRTGIKRYNNLNGTNHNYPSYETFRNRFHQVNPYEKAKLAYGKRKADQDFRVIKEKIKTTRLLERVEVDHTRLDLFVVDDISRLPMGRPYLTLLIDSHSLSITGFYLGFEPPSFLSVAYALKNSILKKDYVKDEFQSVVNTWPACGVPELLVFDNGKEFWDENLTDNCLDLGIEVLSNPVRHPWLKASVERFFGTVNTELLSSIPGKTFSDILLRGDYDPQKNAVISKSKMIEITHKWIVDVYQVSPNSRETNIPSLVWRESMERFPVRLFDGSLMQLDFKLGKAGTKTLRKDGINFLYVRYHSEELAALRARDGNGKVKIKTLPGNMGFIFVLDCEKNSYFVVPALNQNYAQGLTLWQHNLNRRYAREHIRQNYDIDDLVTAMLEIKEIIESEIQITKKTKTKKSSSSISNRVRAARYLEKNDIGLSKQIKKAEGANSLTVVKESGRNVNDWTVSLDVPSWSVSTLGKEDE